MPERMTHEALVQWLSACFQWMGGWCPPVLIAMLGGGIKLLRGGSPCSIRAAVASLAIAGFTGWVAHGFLQSLGIPPAAISSGTAIAGYSGGKLLDVLSERACSAAKDLKPDKG